MVQNGYNSVYPGMVSVLVFCLIKVTEPVKCFTKSVCNEFVMTQLEEKDCTYSFWKGKFVFFFFLLRNVQQCAIQISLLQLLLLQLGNNFLIIFLFCCCCFPLSGMIFMLCFISAEKQTTFTDYSCFFAFRQSVTVWSVALLHKSHHYCILMMPHVP